MTRSIPALRSLALGTLVLGALALAACAKTSEGTDSTTHFLQSCEGDAECGALACLCGVCTRACERDATCADLAADASCARTAASCEQAEMACTRSASGEDGGARDAAMPATDGGPAMSCTRMDARSSGDFCLELQGFAWNGLSCDPVVCGCEGADCAAIHADQTACEEAFRDCAPITMCTQPADCKLVSSGCCDCEIEERELGAISKQASGEHSDRICGEVVCDVCSGDPFEPYLRRFLPACVPATRWEGGECTLADLARLRCNASDGCRVRTRTCCECPASTAIDNLMAVPNGGDTTWFNAICAPNQACADCDMPYPDNVEARCAASGFCELYEDGALVPL